MIKWILPAITAASFVASVVVPIALNPYFLDSSIVLRAAEDLWNGIPVYQFRPEISDHTKPPLASLFFLPFILLPKSLLFLLWCGLQVWAVYEVLRWVKDLQSKRYSVDVSSVYLGFLLCMNLIQREWRFGQYNLITFSCLLVATRTSGLFWKSLLFVFAVLLKPMNLIFLPWVYGLNLNSLGKKAVALMSVGVLLSLIFCALFGVTRFYNEHLHWLSHLSESTHRQLSNPINMGIASFLIRMGWQSLSSTGVLIMGLLIGWTLSFRLRDEIRVLFLLTVFSVVTSPMAWFQNGVVLLPFVILFASMRREPLAKWLLALCAVSQTILFSPVFIGAERFDVWRPASIPLFGWILVLPLGLLLLGRAGYAPSTHATHPNHSRNRFFT